MSGCRLAQSRIHGFDSLMLSNDCVSLMLVPHLAGKLMSLYDRRHQHEWLWTNPLLTHLRPLSSNRTEEQFELGGWDECFPGLRCAPYPLPPWTHLTIPLHGDLWSHDWKTAVEESSDARLVLRLGVEGEDLPYRFERTLTLLAGEPALYFHYQLTNLSHVPMPFVWSAHPLLRVEPGMRVSLPPHTRLWVDHTVPAGVLEAGSLAEWPRVTFKGHLHDLSLVPGDSEGWAVKLYTIGLIDGQAAVEHPARRRRLRFRFALGEAPRVGVWLNYGGWGGLEMRPAYHLGVMPCIGGADDLQVAIQRGEYAVLPAAGVKTWDVTVMLE